MVMQYVALIKESLEKVEDELTANVNDRLLTIDDYFPHHEKLEKLLSSIIRCEFYSL